MFPLAARFAWLHSWAMHNFSDMAKSLNRLTIYLSEDAPHMLRESLKIRASILADLVAELATGLTQRAPIA
jgi:hypothetical protein